MSSAGYKGSIQFWLIPIEHGPESVGQEAFPKAEFGAQTSVSGDEIPK